MLDSLENLITFNQINRSIEFFPPKGRFYCDKLPSADEFQTLSQLSADSIELALKPNCANAMSETLIYGPEIYRSKSFRRRLFELNPDGFYYDLDKFNDDIHYNHHVRSFSYSCNKSVIMMDRNGRKKRFYSKRIISDKLIALAIVLALSITACAFLAGFLSGLIARFL